MSDMIQGDELNDEVGVTSAGEIGMTSDEAAAEEKKSWLSQFSIYDAMLLLALIFVTLATLRLFFELRTFGNFPFSFPWRTGEFLK